MDVFSFAGHSGCRFYMMFCVFWQIYTAHCHRYAPRLVLIFIVCVNFTNLINFLRFQLLLLQNNFLLLIHYSWLNRLETLQTLQVYLKSVFYLVIHSLKFDVFITFKTLWIKWYARFEFCAHYSSVRLAESIYIEQSMPSLKVGKLDSKHHLCKVATLEVASFICYDISYIHVF